MTYKKPSFINTFAQSLRLYKKVYMAILPVTVLYAFLSGISQYYLIDIMQTEHGLLHDPHKLCVAIGHFALDLILGLFFTAITLSFISSYSQQQPISLITALQRAFIKIFDFMIASLIVLLPIFGAAGILLFKYLYLKDTTPSITYGCYLGAAFCVLIQLYVGIRCYVVLVIIIANHVDALTALQTSWKLSAGYWWNTFLLILTYVLCTLPVNIMINIFITLFVLFVPGMQQTSILMMIVPQCLLQLILFPLVNTMMTTQKNELEMAYSTQNHSPNGFAAGE